MVAAAAGEVVRPGQECEPGCLPLEWVGSPNPTDDPRVLYAIQQGTLSERQLKVLEAAQARAVRPMRGKRVRRTMEYGERSADLAGLSMRYSWGPREGMYVLAVRFRDADIILASGSGFQFRDASKPGPRLLLPTREPVRIVGREEFHSIDDYRRAVEA